MRGKNLIIATTQNYPLSYATEVNGTLVGSGVAFNFINLLQKRYQFTYKVILPEEDILGTETTGIFGLLNTGVSNITNFYIFFSR